MIYAVPAKTITLLIMRPAKSRFLVASYIYIICKFRPMKVVELNFQIVK